MHKTSGRTDDGGVAAPRSARLKLSPGPFIAAVAALYLLGLAAQFLTAPAIPLRWALWPFLLAQIVFLGLWYGMHAARLRDAGRSLSLAQGVAAIYALAIVLLLLIAAFFTENLTGTSLMPRSILLLRDVLTFSRGTGDLVTYLGLIAALALLIAPSFSIWAALQPGRRAMSLLDLRHVLIHGRVQGVGYRAWLEDRAREFGLQGWVRNRNSGSVEALFVGSHETVTKMVELCRQGPYGAHVTGIDQRPGLGDDLIECRKGEEFSVLPTV